MCRHSSHKSTTVAPIRSSQERGSGSPVRSDAGRAGLAPDPAGGGGGGLVRSQTFSKSLTIHLHPPNHVNSTLNPSDLSAPFPWYTSPILSRNHLGLQ
ncbi:hypothetical protein CGRA01v4_01609 [Colletotrichum graminicola]|nr:hypothetical protein CGRA01v4_01609 [Colletotrichum graminicola]